MTAKAKQQRTSSLTKAARYSFYRDGMEPEKSGGWVWAGDLPADVRKQYVEPICSPGMGPEDDDDDSIAGT